MNEDEPIEVDVVEIDGAPPPPPRQQPPPASQPAKPLWQQSLERLFSGEVRTLGCLGIFGMLVLLVLGGIVALGLLLIRGTFRAIGQLLRSLLPG